MNKTICCLAAFVLIAAACTKKAMPPDVFDVKGSGKNKAAEKQAMDAGKPAEEKEKALTTTQPPPNNPPGPQKESYEEAGKTLYASKCSKCHAAKNVGSYTFNQWEVILKKMVPNAKLTADEENQVVAYIRANSK